jgi:hypothetical protein
MFGVGALLSTVGFVLAGIGTLHAGRWSGWARWVPARNRALRCRTDVPLVHAAPAGSGRDVLRRVHRPRTDFGAAALKVA